MTGLSPLWVPRKEEGQVKTREESDNASSPEDTAAGGSKKWGCTPKSIACANTRAEDPVSLTPVLLEFSKLAQQLEEKLVVAAGQSRSREGWINVVDKGSNNTTAHD